MLHVLLPTHNRLNISSIITDLYSPEHIFTGEKFIAHRRFAFATLTSFHSKLIQMYAKCRSLVDARKVFNHTKERDVVSWNMIMVAYTRHGEPYETITLFHQMQKTGVKPNRFTFASVFPACAKVGALEQGMHIHQSIKDTGILSDMVVATALVDMYAKCGSIHKAREVFDKMSQKNVFSWTAMIGGYSQNGFDEKALETFKKMQLAGIKPNSITFISILSVCAKMGTLEQGMDIHRSIKDTGILSDVVVATALVDMYAKCGSIDMACELFDRMAQRNVVSWTAMVAGYVQNGFPEKALETFKQMQLAGVKPNLTTVASILPACAKLGAIELGIDIHQTIKDRGALSDVVVATALVDMYAKCGRVDKARELFEKLPHRNVVSWNAMIAGYAQNGFVENALEIFRQMQSSGVQPDSTTFSIILPACAKMGALEHGIDIHQSIKGRGILSDVVVATALLDMYAKCGRADKAGEVFEKMPQKNAISWNAMIAGYAQNGFVEKALETFKQMQLSGVKPNNTTFASILPACAKMGYLVQGVDIHQSIMEGGFYSDITVGNSLLDMYAKCGCLDKACELFNRMLQRDVISWNAMIGGYAQNGCVEKALETFKQMRSAAVQPTSTTFASILPACAKIGALEQGMNIHQSIMEVGLWSDMMVGNALVDMYAKCGSIDKARELFNRMPQRDVISWNAMIAGYAQNGFCKNSLEIFELMKHSVTCPDNRWAAGLKFSWSGD